VSAILQLADVLRVLEAKSPKADPAVIDAVAIKVDHVIRLTGTTGTVEFFAQRGQRGRA
jgi:hypothetical protein